MGQKKTDPTAKTVKNNTAWQEIEAKRLKARRKSLQRKGALIAIVVVIVALLAGGLFFLSSNQSSQGQVSGAAVKASGNDPDQVKGYVIGPQGYGSANPKAPVVELFYSYTCPGCIAFEHNQGQKLVTLAKQGKITLILHPVNVHTFPWTIMAADLVHQVAVDQPEKVLALHNALFEAAFQIMFKDQKSVEQQGNGTALSKPAEALKLLQATARKVGIKENIVQNFQTGPDAKLLNEWTEAWVNGVNKQGGAQAATPMIARNGKILDTQQLFDGDRFKTEVLTGK